MFSKKTLRGHLGALINQTSPPSQGQHLWKMAKIIPLNQHQVNGGIFTIWKADRMQGVKLKI